MAPVAVIGTIVLSIIAAAIWSDLNKNAAFDPFPTVLPNPSKAEGIFAKNTLLQGVQKIGSGELPGPEDLVMDSKGNIYTGCSDGWIKRVNPEGRVQNWTYVGGYPLGLAFGLNGELLVCEPAMGLLNITEEHGVRVLSDRAEGVKFRLADELVISNDGPIYFTDASSKFGMHSWILDALEGRPNGRLLKYSPSTRETTVVLKDLYFPNGVALSAKQDFIVVSETWKARCLKYWLQGPKKGTTEIFLDNLPGFPDNIHHNGNDTFWISLLGKRSAIFERIMGIPAVKRAILFMKLEGFLKNYIYKMAKVVGVKEDGEFVAFLEDPTGTTIACVTSALQVGEHLYVGNLRARDFIGKIKIAS